MPMVGLSCLPDPIASVPLSHVYPSLPSCLEEARIDSYALIIRRKPVSDTETTIASHQLLSLLLLVSY